MKWCYCGLSILLAVQQPTVAPPYSNAAGQDVLQGNTLCNGFTAWQSAAQQQHNALHHSTEQQGLMLPLMLCPVGFTALSDQNVYFNSEASSIHRKPKQRNVWGQ